MAHKGVESVLSGRATYPPHLIRGGIKSLLVGKVALVPDRIPTDCLSLMYLRVHISVKAHKTDGSERRVKRRGGGIGADVLFIDEA